MRSFVLLLLVGCYRPDPQAGARCAAGDRCPSGLACRDNICVDETAPLVDAPSTITDALVIVDAAAPPPPDALDHVGCADGAREAFTSLATFPAIAGCAASWNAALDMRAPPTSQPCGDDLQPCAAPADACSPGWHLCGTDGQPTDLTLRATEAACTSAGSPIADARFVAAHSHCSSYLANTCTYDVPRGCATNGPCAEPVCCGAGCRTDAGCTAGAFESQGIAGTLLHGCASMLAADVTGVLCCR